MTRPTTPARPRPNPFQDPHAFLDPHRRFTLLYVELDALDKARGAFTLAGGHRSGP